jgi:hypothetical protein
MPTSVELLRQISRVPSSPQEFDKWLACTDAIVFLQATAEDDEFILYGSRRHAYLNTVVASAATISNAPREELLKWDFNPTHGWSITHSFSPESLAIASPLERPGSSAYKGAEQLVFVRYFDGRLGEARYVELLQRFLQLFDLHFLEERSAYCRIDERGDIEDVIRIITTSGDEDGQGELFVTCQRDLLDQYLVLTDSVLARTFDFTRYRESDFAGWPNEGTPQYEMKGDIHYRLFHAVGYGSYLRGVQVVRSQLTRETLLKRFDYRVNDREYASFIAYDFKNKMVREISTEPGATANYFTDSELPFETSPVFFRPEVLQKYKADADKYKLEDRSITCRNAWYLKSYDVNEAGQIHTYVVYLRDLPYEEQLYWKSYNEAPKATISKRAYKTDFEGSWDAEYDPLTSLREALRSVENARTGWWKLRSANLPDRVHYPVTTSSDEWANEILALDQLVIEGFEDRWLRSKAKELGRNPKPELRPLRLAEECLIGFGFHQDDARGHLSPFHELHNLRSEIKSHAGGRSALATRKRVLREHKTYTDHFRSLCTQIDESLRLLAEVFARPAPATDS